MNMNPKFSIKNFRAFGSEGVTFELSPITILTGCNSSGKSSMVKAMLLMRNLLEQAKNDKVKNDVFDPTKYSMNFSLPELKLGTFDKVFNRNSKDSTIIFSYTINPNCAIGCYRVEYLIGKRDNDSLNRGWIKEMKLYDKDGELVFDAVNSSSNDMLIKKVAVTEQFKADFCAFLTAAIEMFYDKEMHSYDLLIETDSLGDKEPYLKIKNYLADFQSQYDSKNEYAARFKEFIEYRVNKDQYENLFCQDLHLAYEKWMKYDILLFFPVLEQFANLNKEESIKLLRDTKFPAFTDVNGVIEDFQKSSYESFLDYYRSYEIKEYSNLTQRSVSFNGAMEIDIIEVVKKIASVKYAQFQSCHLGTPLLINFDPETRESKFTFQSIYYFLSIWQWDKSIEGHSSNELISDDYIVRMINEDYLNDNSYHRINEALKDYIALLFEECLIPNLFDGINYIGNFHSDVQRLYTFDDKSNNLGQTVESFLSLEARLRSTQESSKLENKYEPLSFTNKWLNELNIAKSLNIVCQSEGLGASMYLARDDDETLYALADEGYGVSQIVNILLHIELEIISGELVKLHNSVVERHNATPDTGTLDMQECATSILAIEEPEISLHPSMQSALTDIFIDAYQMYGIHFIIETHSEYLIRKTQVYVKNLKEQGEDAINPFSVYYVPKDGGHKPYKMEYRPDGKFKNEFGSGFFDEASNLAFELF